MQYRKYKINETFFDQIDIEQKSYMLGFLFADAYINEKIFNITLNLAEKDKHILYDFANLIFQDNPTAQIKTSKSKIKPYNYYSKLNINGKYITQRIIDLGCVQAKSLIIKFPEEIKNANEIIQRHFIRGYYDGDGGITIKNAQNNLCITSTLDFCQYMKSIIEEYVDINLRIYKYKNVFRLTTHGRFQMLNVLNWLYKDSSIYLKRKYNLYQQVYNEVPIFFSPKMIINFVDMRNKGNTYKEIAEKYGCSDTGVRKAIKRFCNGGNKRYK